MPFTTKDGDDTITYCRCSTCKQDAEGQGPGLVWVLDKKKGWTRGWPIGV